VLLDKQRIFNILRQVALVVVIKINILQFHKGGGGVICSCGPLYEIDGVGGRPAHHNIYSLS
jgi:hypothetical protein